MNHGNGAEAADLVYLIGADILVSQHGAA